MSESREQPHEGELILYQTAKGTLRWDNPNVFVICTLKHSDNTVSRRQEVGRGMRLCVNQRGGRIDDPATVRQANVLTVVASESYRDFVAGLQRDISESLSARPRVADADYFTGKLIQTPTGDLTVTQQMAKQICRYLVKQDYVDENDQFTSKYHDDRELEQLHPPPPELAPYAEGIVKLTDTVFSTSQLPEIEDQRKAKTNPLSANFQKREFQELWTKINRKAAYTVQFDSQELVTKCVRALDKHLSVARLQYTIQRGTQRETNSVEQLESGDRLRGGKGSESMDSCARSAGRRLHPTLILRSSSDRSRAYGSPFSACFVDSQTRCFRGHRRGTAQAILIGLYPSPILSTGDIPTPDSRRRRS